jgi:uncharacterized Zn-binding protein involved in type VI secretion
MSFAARVGDPSAHGGVVTGPGVSNVLVGGLPCAVVGDTHTCSIVPHAVTPFTKGSSTVLIGGRPALRAGDLSGCGSPIATGLPTVTIGG